MQSEPRLQTRSGIYAWDQRDACSIASHTPACRGMMPGDGDEARPSTKLPAGDGPSITVRVASALLSRIRPWQRLGAARG